MSSSLDSAPRALVIGDISMVRALGRAGIPVVLASGDASPPAARSRYCEETLHLGEKGDGIDAIIEWCAREVRERGARPVIFCQGDHDLLALSRRRDEVAVYADFVLPRAELVEDLVDKLRFAALAERAGLPVPATATLRRDDPRVGEIISRWDTFPAVVKPATRMNWMESALVDAVANTGKAIRVESRAELERLLPIVAAHETDCVLQQAIDGGEDRIVSYHAYVRENAARARGESDGEIVVDVSGKKVRTTPRTYGYSTCVTLSRDAEVLRVGRDVVRALSFTGVLKIDFKRDARDGRLYLLEINPRFNLWHHLFAVAGVNIPALVYADCVRPGSAEPPPPGDVRDELVWMSRGDVRAFLEYRRAGELSTKQWLRELATADVNEDLCLHDPMPLVGEVLARVQRIFDANASNAMYSAMNNAMNAMRRISARAAR